MSVITKPKKFLYNLKQQTSGKDIFNTYSFNDLNCQESFICIKPFPLILIAIQYATQKPDTQLIEPTVLILL